MDRDLVLIRSAFDDGRPPLPLAIHRRRAPPPPAQSFTRRQLPDMPAPPTWCSRMPQVPDPPPLPGRCSNQRFVPTAAGTGRHPRHPRRPAPAVSQQPDGAGYLVGEREDRASTRASRRYRRHVLLSMWQTRPGLCRIPSTFDYDDARWGQLTSIIGMRVSEQPSTNHAE